MTKPDSRIAIQKLHTLRRMLSSIPTQIVIDSGMVISDAENLRTERPRSRRSWDSTNLALCWTASGAGLSAAFWL